MSQEDQPEDQAFVQSLRTALRASEAVDTATARRLALARARAVAAVPADTRSGWSWMVPAGMVTAALALVVGLHRTSPVAPVPADQQTADTLDLLTDDKDPQFYRDLDFYKWLEKQPQRHA